MRRIKKTLKEIKPVKKIEPKIYKEKHLIRIIKSSKNQPKWYKKMFEGWL